MQSEESVTMIYEILITKETEVAMELQAKDLVQDMTVLWSEATAWQSFGSVVATKSRM